MTYPVPGAVNVFTAEPVSGSIAMTFFSLYAATQRLVPSQPRPHAPAVAPLTSSVSSRLPFVASRRYSLLPYVAIQRSTPSYAASYGLPTETPNCLFTSPSASVELTIWL